jgi:hypothetical protein
MSASLSSSSSQSTNNGANQTTVYVSATVTITAGYFQGLQSHGRITIGDVTYVIDGPTYMAALSDPHVAPESWGFSAQRTYDHDINGYLGGIGISASFDVDGASFHNCSSDTSDQGYVNIDRKPAAVTGTAATVNADKSVTVTFSGGASPGGSPALSSTYNIQYSQNGGTFTSAGTGTSPKVITGLTPGSNYVFRVFATNQSNDGAGAYADSTSVFLPSGGKRYDGASYIPTQTAKRYDGSAWQTIVTAKRYDGTSWVNLT